MPKQTSREGELLAGKYRLDALLGAGGMGEVYRAENVSIGRAVAIKVLRSQYANMEEVVVRFLREARAANIVRHPNVVDVLDIGRSDDGTAFIVQELLEGQDLSAYVRSNGGKIGVAEAIDLLLPVIDAVAFAHERGVIHRDLKPENVFLARGPNGKVVPKLLDFGISRIVSGDDQKRMTAPGMSVGTPAYMSPEQIRADRVIDARTDVWSLGVILHELLSGTLPFEAEAYSGLFVKIVTQPPVPLSTALPGAPRALTAVVDRCLRANLAERYPSASDVARDLLVARRAPSMLELERASVPATPVVARSAVTLAAPKLTLDAPRTGPSPAPRSVPGREALAVPDLAMPEPRAKAVAPVPRTSAAKVAVAAPAGGQRIAVEGDFSAEIVPTGRLELDFGPGRAQQAAAAVHSPPVARANRAMRMDAPTPMEAAGGAAGFFGMAIMWAIVLAATGGLASLGPTGAGWPVVTWLGALDHAAPWVAASIAGTLGLFGIASFVMGARAQPTSWGLVLAAPGLLAEAFVVAGFAVDGLPRITGSGGFDSLERILCPWPMALVLFGASVLAMRRAWRSWATARPGRTSVAAVGLVLAIATLFGAVEIARGAEATAAAASTG